MLGVVFTEFLEMVEDRFSMDTVDAILDATNTTTDGSYTAVGQYKAEEILALVVALSDHTNTPVPTLVRAFGQHLFPRLAKGHPETVAGLDSSLQLLEHIESHIHVQVRKLYPNAELPHFATERHGEHSITMTYSSSRPLAGLALGLIEGCAEYFGETLHIEHVDTSEGAGTSATFNVTRLAN
ncbi:MAG: heme NO-binding domain-containing protein [Myxococcota bacterium]